MALASENRPVNLRVPKPEYWDTRHAWQVDATRALDVEGKRFLDILCHRGARKTTWAINTLIRECVRNPMRSYGYIAPTHVQAMKVVWIEPTMLFHWLPDRTLIPWVENKTDGTITFPNKSVLGILGADKPDSIRGLNAYGYVVDEFAECKDNLWPEILQPIMRRTDQQGYGKRWCAFSYTSKGIATYAYQLRQVTRDDPEWYHVTIRASESGILAPEELEATRRTTPKAMYDQEYECIDQVEEAFALITSAMLLALPYPLPEGTASCPRKKRIIACDPAMGGDACVIYVFNGVQAQPPIVLYTRNLDQVYAVLVKTSKETGIVDFIVDSIGIGEGVCRDLAKHEEFHVQRFCSSEEGVSDTQVRNKRAEMWWYVKGEIEAGRAERPVDRETLRQLPYASRYQVRSGKIQMVEKSEIKKLLGCSPDHAEAWSMGLYGLQKAQEYQQRMVILGRRRWRKYRQPEPVDPMQHCG